MVLILSGLYLTERIKEKEMDKIGTIEYKGYAIEVYYDSDPISPREWDNLGTMVCFHNRYNLGDEHNYEPEEIIELVQRKDVIALPLYLYDHSGITMSCNLIYPFNDRWDAGQVGFIFVDYATIREEYGCKYVTSAMKKKIISYLENEVDVYDEYLVGNVYGFKVVNDEGEEIDSCWGYYGDINKSGLLDEAKGTIDYEIKQRESFVFANEGIGL